MANSKKNKNGKQMSRGAQKRAEMRAEREKSAGGGGPIATPVLIAGSVLLAIAAASAGTLAYAELAGQTAPGCGPGSGCEAATNSVWGKIPGINWPTSFLGTAYFLAMLVAWIAVRKQGVPPAMRWIARLGVLGSLFLLGVIITDPKLSCQYCLASHACNLLWVVLMEVAARKAAPAASRVAIGSFGGSFVAATGLLLIANVAVAQFIDRDFEENLGEIGSNSNINDDGEAGGVPVLKDDDGMGFRGKYVIGPADAPVRFVVFSDYQCPDCKKVEMDILELLKEYPDTISLTHKHFPMNADCNEHVSRTLHGNACWAARAAEAAGILGGSDAFWAMHYKLFEIDGMFTDATLPGIVEEIGFDYREFVSVMQSEQTLQTIREDADEAIALGLHYTPFVFVNGTEIRRFNAANAMRRAAEYAMSQNPPRGDHTMDRPQLAIGKFISDWQGEPVRNAVNQDAVPHARGAEEPIVDLVVYGNYGGDATPRFEEYLDEALATRPWVRYTFRHYPFDQECNPTPSRTLYEYDCEAARAAEAAAVLEGEDGFWKMHEWLFDHRTEFAQPDIWDRAAAHLGVNTADFKATMASSTVEEAIADDALAGRRSGVRGLPSLHMNGRFVPRWLLKGQSVLGELFDAAYETATGEKP